jgi:hypothetical protein
MERALLILALVSLFGCSEGEVTQRVITQEEPKQYFSKHKVGKSPDYAIVKDGDDYLATIHGYMDDQAVCLALT